MLVVEDSPTIASVVKYFLELEGFEVLLAADGLAGLDMALREHPDVIVSDVNMPGMGGVAMVKALRADPLMSDVRDPDADVRVEHRDARPRGWRPAPTTTFSSRSSRGGWPRASRRCWRGRGPRSRSRRAISGGAESRPRPAA